MRPREGGARLYCPYCYQDFTEQQIEFRCSGTVGRGGQRCAPEVDPVLRAHMGFTGALPPVFTADGRQASAPCPRCGAGSPAKVCPVCHSQLPVHFGKMPSRMIALVGAKQSGKTVYMTVLLHELMHDLGRQLDAAISGADDRTMHRFGSEYEGPLYRDSLLLPPTTTAGLHNRVPMVFRFTTGGSGWLRRGSRPGRAEGGALPHHTLLSFFDAAGEELQTQRSVEQNVRYLAAADAVILLLDPHTMPGVPGGIPGADAGTGTPADDAGDHPANVLSNITNLMLATGRRGKPDWIRKPLAVVFSKMDPLLTGLSPTSPLLQPPPRTAYLDERDSAAVHEEMRRLLDQWQGPRLDQLAKRHYTTYRYFGVSALGENPTADNRVAARGIRPLRVADPFMWTLAQLGAIPVKRG